jgi:hypothetical protein
MGLRDAAKRIRRIRQRNLGGPWFHFGRSPNPARLASSRFLGGLAVVEFGERVVSRRALLRGAAMLWGVVLLPASLARSRGAQFRVSKAAQAAIKTSELIYITPIKSDGKESSCHAEVWFYADGADLLVVTKPELWRSQAIERGLDRARIWVGDHGVWKRSNDAFRNAPSFLAQAEHSSSDAEAVGRTLKAMSAKYADDGWSTYGPRFEQGLADGSRVLLRYRPIAE